MIFSNGLNWLCRLTILFVTLSFDRVLRAGSLEISSEFLLDIDGSSLSTSLEHACVIAYKHGVDVGGKVICWTGRPPEHDLNELTPPEHVRHT